MAIITTAVLQAAVRAWLVSATGGIEVIFADQAKPRPASRPYVTVSLGLPRTVGYDDAGDLTDPGAPAYASRAMRGDRVLTASIQVLGVGAADVARAASNALTNVEIREDLRAAGIAPKDNGVLTDLSALMETDWEDRAGLEVEFVFADSYTDTVPLIEKVTGTGTYEPGTIVDPFSAEVP